MCHLQNRSGNIQKLSGKKSRNTADVSSTWEWERFWIRIWAKHSRWASWSSARPTGARGSPMRCEVTIQGAGSAPGQLRRNSGNCSRLWRPWDNSAFKEASDPRLEAVGICTASLWRKSDIAAVNIHRDCWGWGHLPRHASRDAMCPTCEQMEVLPLQSNIRWPLGEDLGSLMAVDPISQSGSMPAPPLCLKGPKGRCPLVPLSDSW